MAAAKPPTPETSGETDRVLSSTTAEAVGGMFKQLSDFRREQRRLAEFPMGGEQRTIEDVVRDLLSPMMREWLDANATPIVERVAQIEFTHALGDFKGA